ncbi:MAG TPA: MarR family transcriptional regulator, partial [Anaerolineales bacterium]
MFNIEQSVTFMLSKAIQGVSAVFNEELKGHGITPRQFMLLAILWKTDGLCQTELARRAGIDKATMGGIIDRLEKAEFLERRPSPDDRRTHEVWLSHKGRCLEEDLCHAACRARDRIRGLMLPGEYRLI